MRTAAPVLALAAVLLALAGCSSQPVSLATPASATPTTAAAVTTAARSQDDLFMADFLDTPGLSTTMSRADTLALAHSMCDIIGTPGIPSHAYLVQQLGTSKLGPQVTDVMLTAAEANLCPLAQYTASSAPASSAAPAPAPTAPTATTSQSNAVDKAESYLSFSAFSRTGLIKQLKFEQFSTADATYAVDHVTVDWTAQADLKAKSYMEFSSFSRGGLIKQLKFEGFTQAQAEHGAKSVGL
ncbi:MAG: hypothetical protein QOG20_5219 [Pseudonocardiales bacterium]|jgi:hypothetical protein|nr:hypothetical protein [Pseudonocardiales bacterium]